MSDILKWRLKGLALGPTGVGLTTPFIVGTWGRGALGAPRGLRCSWRDHSASPHPCPALLRGVRTSPAPPLPGHPREKVRAWDVPPAWMLTLAHSPWPRALPSHTFPPCLAHRLCFLRWGHPQIPGASFPGDFQPGAHCLFLPSYFISPWVGLACPAGHSSPGSSIWPPPPSPF